MNASLNRWIAAVAMGLATAANAPAAAPPAATPASDAHGVISDARAAPGEGVRPQSAGLALGGTHPSLISENGENALAANAPDPVIAWILAAGFLGVIVTRRTRASRSY